MKKRDSITNNFHALKNADKSTHRLKNWLFSANQHSQDFMMHTQSYILS